MNINDYKESIDPNKGKEPGKEKASEPMGNINNPTYKNSAELFSNEYDSRYTTTIYCFRCKEIINFPPLINRKSFNVKCEYCRVNHRLYQNGDVELIN